MILSQFFTSPNTTFPMFKENNILQQGANEIPKSSPNSLWFEFKANIIFKNLPLSLSSKPLVAHFASREFPLQQNLERFGSCCCQWGVGVMAVGQLSVKEK